MLNLLRVSKSFSFTLVSLLRIQSSSYQRTIVSILTPAFEARPTVRTMFPSLCDLIGLALTQCAVFAIRQPKHDCCFISVCKF